MSLSVLATECAGGEILYLQHLDLVQAFSAPGCLGTQSTAEDLSYDCVPAGHVTDVTYLKYIWGEKIKREEIKTYNQFKKNMLGILFSFTLHAHIFSITYRGITQMILGGGWGLCGLAGSFWLLCPLCRSGCSFWLLCPLCRSGCSFWLLCPLCRSACSFWLLCPLCRSGCSLISPFGCAPLPCVCQAGWNHNQFSTIMVDVTATVIVSKDE